MKKTGFRIFAMIMVMVLLFASVGAVLAGSTTKNLSTNFTLVNFENATATGVIEYFKDTGVTWPGVSTENKSFSIPGNSQQQFRQYFDTTMEAGQGSVVVSSSSPLGAVAQILARGQTPSSGAYAGFQSGSNKFYLPNVARRGSSQTGIVNSQIVVQNADSVNLNVTVELVPLPGYTSSYTKNISNLAPGVSYYYDLADEANITDPSWFGSAVVTASLPPPGTSTGNEKIAVISNLFAGPDALQTYNGFPLESLTSTWAVPFFSSKLGNGQSTVVTVQNLTGGTIAINGLVLDCVKDPTAGGVATLQVKNDTDIADKASFHFNAATNAAFPRDWYGSCKVTAPGSVVAYVQIRYIGVAGNSGAAAYEAIPLSASTTNKTMFAPLVGKRLGNGFATAVLIQNLDFNNPTNVTITYTPSKDECPASLCDRNGDKIVDVNDAITLSPLPIDKGGSIQRNMRLTSGAPNSEPNLPDGWVGSMKIVSDTTPINGIIQITNIYNTLGDTFMAHDGFTKP